MWSVNESYFANFYLKYFDATPVESSLKKVHGKMFKRETSPKIATAVSS